MVRKTMTMRETIMKSVVSERLKARFMRLERRHDIYEDRCLSAGHRS